MTKEQDQIFDKDSAMEERIAREFPPRIWVAEDGSYSNGRIRWGCAELPGGCSPPMDSIVYIPEALLEAARRKARAEAFDSVLEQAQKLYEEEIDSDPSDYFYTRKAIEMAREEKE